VTELFKKLKALEVKTKAIWEPNYGAWSVSLGKPKLVATSFARTQKQPNQKACDLSRIGKSTEIEMLLEPPPGKRSSICPLETWHGIFYWSYFENVAMKQFDVPEKMKSRLIIKQDLVTFGPDFQTVLFRWQFIWLRAWSRSVRPAYLAAGNTLQKLLTIGI
jgi:hypothetical protein